MYPPKELITWSVYFKTTYGFDFSQGLTEYCNPNEDMNELRHMYGKSLYFGCDVNAQIIIEEKLDPKDNQRLDWCAFETEKLEMSPR